MERKRLNSQRLKQQQNQQQRFCVSQQDLTENTSHKELPLNNVEQHRQSYGNEENRTIYSSTSCLETLYNTSISQLIKQFEEQKSKTSFASVQNLLPICSNVPSNIAESDSSQMLTGTMKIKVDFSDNEIINNDVCSTISSPVINDNQMVIIEKDQQKLAVDKEKENDDESIYETLDIDDHHQTDLQLSSFSTLDIAIKHHQFDLEIIEMSRRSTDIDEAASDYAKRNAVRFHDLLAKEAQLNSALADLFSISNENDKSLSINATRRSAINNRNYEHLSTTLNTTSISTSAEMLNNLLESIDATNRNSNTKKQIITKDQISQKNDDNHVKPINVFCLMLSDNICANCHQSFATNEQIVNAAGHIWHTHCFVCTQCFQPFENGIYFEHEDRKYCERDFQMLFAPCCAECKQAIVGRVIRALQKCFHPDCFRCQSCQAPLIEMGFSKYNGRALCRECYAKEKLKDLNLSKQICATCHQLIDNKHLKYKGEFHHPYHFQCTSCGIELDENSRELRGSLYCLPCHNKLDIPVCAACRRLIDDRVISALGKQWHVEHFCCARCAQPFYGSKHFEHKGLAYCEADYHFLFGSTCFICNCIITEGAYTACNKKYCAEHFACSICEKKMNEKSKFFDVDASPVCKQCFGKLPSQVRKSVQQPKKKALGSPMKQTSV